MRPRCCLTVHLFNAMATPFVHKHQTDCEESGLNLTWPQSATVFKPILFFFFRLSVLNSQLPEQLSCSGKISATKLPKKNEFLIIMLLNKSTDFFQVYPN